MLNWKLFFFNCSFFLKKKMLTSINMYLCRNCIFKNVNNSSFDTSYNDLFLIPFSEIITKFVHVCVCLWSMQWTGETHLDILSLAAIISWCFMLCLLLSHSTTTLVEGFNFKYVWHFAAWSHVAGYKTAASVGFVGTIPQTHGINISL